MPWRADLAGALALGALQTLSFVFLQAWWLQSACVAALAWRAAQVAPRRAAALGLAFGSGWLCAGTWWLYISLHRYGGLAAWMAVLAVALLAAALSLYLAAAMAAFARWRSGGAARDAWFFGALWLLAELARAVIFTGFPWLASGYAHIDGPLAVLAPWVGVYGIGVASAVAAAWLVLPKSRSWRGWAPPLLFVAALLGLGAAGPVDFTRPTGTLSVTLLQGNVAQDEKFSLERMPEALDWTRKQLLAARGDLVVGPETVIPLLPSQLDPGYWLPLAAHFREGAQAVLLGMPLGDEQNGFTNSAVGLSAATATLPEGRYRYDKHHLVPFGEFIPPGFRWFTEMMDIPLGDFRRGALAAPPFVVRGERVAPNICYEDLYGEELAARFTDPANAPTLFANISNIGWFGDTIAIDQHLNISRLRALEFQRPMLRATNTGATVVIDHRGQVLQALAPYTQGVLEGRVQGRDGLTPFAWWASRFGLALPALLAFGVIAAQLVHVRSTRLPAPPAP